MSKKLETKFKEKVLKDLREIPDSWFEKIQQVSLRGTPDVLGCINGRFVALELKKDGIVPPDPLQLYKLQQIKKAHGISLVAHPENWPYILRLLTRLI